MSADPTQVLAFETDCHIFENNGCGFPAPGLHSFLFEPLWGNGDSNVYFNKTMLLALLGSVIVVAFFWAAFRKPKVVPGKLQMVAEAATTSSAAASSTRRSARRKARSTYRWSSRCSSSSG